MWLSLGDKSWDSLNSAEISLFSISSDFSQDCHFNMMVTLHGKLRKYLEFENSIKKSGKCLEKIILRLYFYFEKYLFFGKGFTFLFFVSLSIWFKKEKKMSYYIVILNNTSLFYFSNSSVLLLVCNSYMTGSTKFVSNVCGVFHFHPVSLLWKSIFLFNKMHWPFVFKMP